MEEKVRSAYRKILDAVFEAEYIGRREMTRHRRRDGTKRPVYRVESRDFEKKLESIRREVEGLEVNGKEVWRGISGPPEYDEYWLWGSENSERGEYEETEEYRVTDISVESLGYDAAADYCYYVDIDVDLVNA